MSETVYDIEVCVRSFHDPFVKGDRGRVVWKKLVDRVSQLDRAENIARGAANDGHTITECRKQIRLDEAELDRLRQENNEMRAEIAELKGDKE